MPATGAESWTVLGDDWATVGPVEQYLAYLSAIERSPGTVRAYAFGLKLWSEFLAGRGLDWDKVGVDAVAQFVGWLRAPADNVVVLDAGTARRSAATVNRHLAAVFGLYDYHARTGLKVASESGGLEADRAGLVQALLAPRDQGAAGPHPPGQAGGAPPGPPHPHRRAGPGAPGRLWAPAGPFLACLVSRDRHEGWPSPRPPSLRLRQPGPRGARRPPRRQRQRGPGQDALGARAPGEHGVGAPVLGVHAHRVRGTGLRLCVCQPVVRAEGVGAENLVQGRRPGLSCWGTEAEDEAWPSRSSTLPSSVSPSCYVSHAVGNKTWLSKS